MPPAGTAKDKSATGKSGTASTSSAVVVKREAEDEDQQQRKRQRQEEEECPTAVDVLDLQRRNDVLMRQVESMREREEQMVLSLVNSSAGARRSVIAGGHRFQPNPCAFKGRAYKRFMNAVTSYGNGDYSTVFDVVAKGHYEIGFSSQRVSLSDNGCVLSVLCEGLNPSMRGINRPPKGDPAWEAECFTSAVSRAAKVFDEPRRKKCRPYMGSDSGGAFCIVAFLIFRPPGSTWVTENGTQSTNADSNLADFAVANPADYESTYCLPVLFVGFEKPNCVCRHGPLGYTSVEYFNGRDREAKWVDVGPDAARKILAAKKANEPVLYQLPPPLKTSQPDDDDDGASSSPVRAPPWYVVNFDKMEQTNVKDEVKFRIRFV